MADWSKEHSYLCSIKFHKWMKCNQMSEVKVSTIRIADGSFAKYDCFPELRELAESCNHGHLRFIFDMYHFRVSNSYFKDYSKSRYTKLPNQWSKTLGSEKLYY